VAILQQMLIAMPLPYEIPTHFRLVKLADISRIMGIAELVETRRLSLMQGGHILTRELSPEVAQNNIPPAAVTRY